MSAAAATIARGQDMQRTRLLTLILTLLTAHSAGFAGGEEVRGLWVVRTSLKSPESIDRMVEEAAAAGFNTLFVQVRGRGDALYKSQNVPRSELLQDQPESFDPLAYTLQKARPRGIKVHAWINTCLVASFSDRPSNPSHVLQTHVDWLSVPASLAGRQLTRSSHPLDRIRTASRKYGNEIEGYFLDPSDPGAAEHLRKVVREITTGYRVDGVHLDYFRYPHSGFGYSARALEDFRSDVEKQMSSKQRQRLRKKSGRDALIYVRSYPVAWDAWRRRQVTELLASLHRTVKGQSRVCLLSVAVVADNQSAYRDRLQDWKRWLEEGLLDAVCPMAYSSDSETFKTQVATARGFSFGRSVWAGIGAWQMKLPDILEKIQLSRRIGTEGFILFSYDGLVAETPVNPAGRNLRRIGSFLNDEPAQPGPVSSSR